MEQNWKETVNELLQHVTYAKVCDETGLALSSLADLRSGKTTEPKYGPGQVMLRMLDRERAKAKRRDTLALKKRAAKS